jgi:hypothetical protein
MMGVAYVPDKQMTEGADPAPDDWAATVAAFLHSRPKREPCDHDFRGWRDFEDGNGGEQVCTKCGLGAMAHTLRQEGWG